jgi:hypothetical protein
MRSQQASVGKARQKRQKSRRQISMLLSSSFFLFAEIGCPSEFAGISSEFERAFFAFA